MDPGTATIIATALATAAKSAGEAASGASASKAAKRRSKESKRETYAGLLNDALQGGSELQAHHMHTRGRSTKRSAQSMQDTADLVRGAFNI